MQKLLLYISLFRSRHTNNNIKVNIYSRKAVEKNAINQFGLEVLFINIIVFSL